MQTSDYAILPKLGEIVSTLSLKIQFTVYLDQQNIDMRSDLVVELVNFQIRQLARSEIAPFLKGVCGDFVKGVEQLAGTIQSPLKTAKTSE